MGSDLRIGVAGATGALGKEILAVLDQSPWRPSRIVPLAGPTTSTPFVTYGSQQVAVDELGREDLDGLDALVVALPREAAGRWVDAAALAGTPVIDASACQLDRLDVPLVVPWVNRESLDVERVRDVVATPSAAATLLATVLAPLKSELDGAVEATVFLPASAAGRPGIDELSKQVVALFNAQTPPRKVFPHGLAFDLLPLVGEPASSGWTSEELRIVAEVARLTGERVDVSLVGVPVFSGVTASLRIEVQDDLPDERIVELLGEGNVRVVPSADVRRTPRPRRVEGEPEVHVGRIRRAQDGRVLHLVAAMDNLRVGAAVVVGVAGAVLRARGLAGADA